MFIESQEFQSKVSDNEWESPESLVDNLKRIIKCIESKEWQWGRNMDCKYVNVRIDMRDGGHVIVNQRGKRCRKRGVPIWQIRKLWHLRVCLEK